MLTIHMKGRTGNGGGILSQLDVHALFRTLRLVGEVPFIEPRDGMLLNLTLVERIEFDDGGAAELTTEEATSAMEDEREGGLIAQMPRLSPTVHEGPDGSVHAGPRASCLECPPPHPGTPGATQWNG